ncbi:MAG: DUF4330 domain-containing protein [Cyanobacteriota bacterium]|nr:DUF4330 domain-containing protein [Cyanobacteriota bacterium]
MKLLDSKGRLFGQISILDLGAALVIVLVVVGIFFFPGTSGSVAQNQLAPTTKPVEVRAIVRGLGVLDPDSLIQYLQETGKTNIVIRNQPYGSVDIKAVETLPRTLAIPQPDGSVKALPDPRDNFYSVNLILTLGGKATITDDGPVMGNSKLKIGTLLELEDEMYSFNASTIDVKVLE